MTSFKQFFKKLNPMVLAILVLFTISCQPKSQIGSAQRPLHITTVPYEALRSQPEKWSQLCTQLHKKTGLHFQCSIAKSHVQAIAQLNPLHGNAQAALLNPFSYLLAKDLFGAKAIATATRRKNKTIYYSQVVFAANQNIQNLKDLANKKVAFMSRYSTSGHIIPRIYLNNANIRLQGFIFSGSFRQSYELLRQKKVDAIFTYGSSEQNKTFIPIEQIKQIKQIEQKEILKDNPKMNGPLNAIQIPLAIPYERLAVSSKLDPAIVRQLEQGLLALNGDLFSDIEGFSKPDPQQITKLKKYINSSGLKLEELIPGGIRLITDYKIITPGLSPMNQ